MTINVPYDFPSDFPMPGTFPSTEFFIPQDQVVRESPADMPETFSDSDKLYVLVRSDLTHGQQLAQVGHATAAYAHWNPESGADSRPIVVLAVADEKELVAMGETGSATGKYMWMEYGYGDPQFTAFAVVSDGLDFYNLSLAGKTTAQSPSCDRAPINTRNVIKALEYLNAIGATLTND